MAYLRKFVILKKELGNMVASNLKGHSKLEVKGVRGNLGINIENGEVNDFYDVKLIFKNDSKPEYNLGKIFTDDLGRGKGDYGLILKDFKLDEILGILIARGEAVFLAGYIGRENGEIEEYIGSSYKDFAREEEELTVGPVEMDLEESEAGFEGGIIEEGQTEGEEEEVQELPAEDEVEADYKVIEHMKKINQKDQTMSYVLSILRYFPYTEPFKYNLEGYNWWMVELDGEKEYESFLPYFSYLTGGNNKGFYDAELVSCNQLMSKYGHYIFGLYNEDEEVKYIVYGVPGKFKKEEHPNRGKDGFNTWYEGENIEGYWIIYIDPMTGQLIYPLNPMNPME